MGKLFSFYSLSCNKKGIPNLVKVFIAKKLPLHCHSAIHAQYCSVDVSCFVGSEESVRAGNL